jgi:hypothetical protein
MRERCGKLPAGGSIPNLRRLVYAGCDYETAIMAELSVRNTVIADTVSGIER